VEMKQEWLSAIDARTSRRTYREEKIKQDTVKQIQAMVDLCNRESGLSIRFVEDGAEQFQSFSSSYGMFRGVRSYFAMGGKKDLPHLQELAGYFGELLVLECTVLQLGTCWIGGTYDKAACRKQIGMSEEEELLGVITVGYVNPEKTLKEKAIGLLGKKTKKPEEFIKPSTGLPDWVTKGMVAVSKAPSAVNRQPVRFTYEAGTVKAAVDDPTAHQGIDLGIAKAHFELGAWGAKSTGKWILQNGEFIFQ
jgi:nitroreductase